MAQSRQSGMERYGALHHHYHHHSSNSALSNDHTSIGFRSVPYNKQVLRARRSARSDKLRLSIGTVVFVLLLVLIVTILTHFYISGFRNRNDDHDKEVNSHYAVDDDWKNDRDFLTNLTGTRTFKVSFGKGSTAHGRDSRYWDKDDRRRGDDYNENVVESASLDARDESSSTIHVSVKLDKRSKNISADEPHKSSEWKRIGLYNEAGRNELKIYETEYEESLKSTSQSGKNSGIKNQQSNDKEFGVHNESIDVDNEYDDNVEFHGTKYAEYEDSENDKGDHSDLAKIQNQFHRQSSEFHDVRKRDQNIAKNVEEASSNLFGDYSLKSQNSGNDANYKLASLGGGQSTKASRSESKKKAKRHKFSGSCEMKISNSTTQLVEPLESKKFARFFLLYTEMENKPDREADWEPRFAGHQSLQEWEESFLAHDKKINCGFVKAPQGYQSTGFDLAEDDANYISRCHIAVVSCIFGNSDHLRTPAGKTVTRVSRKYVCFVLFMDEPTLQTLSSDGHIPDRTGFIGLWKIVVVRNLPYTDMRRVGKIPKLLSHRLFPSARYSIWMDSKLRLQLDPLLILEYFLWRKGYEYAISNHYDRHCVWDEVAQNKRLNKYNHTVIDQQFEFYQADGLKRFDPLDPNKLLPSNVPEGSFIVRAHTPMSNLFSCLWFNEVDQFTSRDQLSFAYTYQKLRRMNPGKMFYLNMFKDCERRTVTKLFRHRSEEKWDLRQQEVT